MATVQPYSTAQILADTDYYRRVVGGLGGAAFAAIPTVYKYAFRGGQTVQPVSSVRPFAAARIVRVGRFNTHTMRWGKRTFRRYKTRRYKKKRATRRGMRPLCKKWFRGRCIKRSTYKRRSY